jgi:hypothetical protein
VLNICSDSKKHEKVRILGSSLFFLPRNAQKLSVSGYVVSSGHCTGKRAELCNYISESGPRPSCR